MDTPLFNQTLLFSAHVPFCSSTFTVELKSIICTSVPLTELSLLSLAACNPLGGKSVFQCPEWAQPRKQRERTERRGKKRSGGGFEPRNAGGLWEGGLSKHSTVHSELIHTSSHSHCTLSHSSFCLMQVHKNWKVSDAKCKWKTTQLYSEVLNLHLKLI